MQIHIGVSPPMTSLSAAITPSKHRAEARKLYKGLLKGIDPTDASKLAISMPNQFDMADVNALAKHYTKHDPKSAKTVEKLAYHAARGGISPGKIGSTDYMSPIKSGKHWAGHSKVISPKYHKEEAAKHKKAAALLHREVKKAKSDQAHRNKLLNKRDSSLRWAAKHEQQAYALAKKFS